MGAISQPAAFSGIDWGNPCAAGLKIAMVGGLPFNFVTGDVWRGAANKLPAEKMSGDGRCYVANGTNDSYLQAPAASADYIPSVYTVYALIASAVLDAGLTRRFIAGKDSGLTRNNWDLVQLTDHKFYMQAYDLNTTTTKATGGNLSAAATGGRYHVFGEYSASALKIWVNGALHSSAFSMSQAGLSAIPSVAGISWAARSCASLSPVQMMWSGALNDAQRYALMDNPWQVFR